MLSTRALVPLLVLCGWASSFGPCWAASQTTSSDDSAASQTASGPKAAAQKDCEAWDGPASEAKLWKAVCSTGYIGTANASQLEDEEVCQKERVPVDAQFINRILTSNPYKTRIAETGLHLVGVSLIGPLDLSGQAIPGNISFSCFKFLDNVNFDRTTVSGSVSFASGSFEHLSLTRSHISGFVTMTDVFAHALLADDMKTERGFTMVRGTFEGKLRPRPKPVNTEDFCDGNSDGVVCLRRIHIADSVMLRDVVAAYLVADNSKIDGDFTVKAVGLSGKAILDGSQVRNLSFQGNVFALNASKIETAGGVLVQVKTPAAFPAEVTIDQASIGGELRVLNTDVDILSLAYTRVKGVMDLSFAAEGGLYAPGLQVDGPSSFSFSDSALLTLQKRLQELEPGVDVTHLRYVPVECLEFAQQQAKEASQQAMAPQLRNGGTSQKKVYLSEKVIKHSPPARCAPLFQPTLQALFSSRCGLETFWSVHSQFVLHDARLHSIDVVSLDNQDPALALLEWPLSIETANMTFDSVRRTQGGHVEGLFPVEWYLCWLRRGSAFGGFDQHNYKQVADSFQSRGDNAFADDIRVAGKNGERSESCSRGPIVDCLYLVLSWTMVGYGYRMWLPLCWLTGFVLVGACVFGSIPVKPPFNEVWQSGKLWQYLKRGIIYSLDMFLPLIRLDEDNYKVKLVGWQKYYLYVHKLVGWMLSAYVVAAITGLTKSGVAT